MNAYVRGAVDLCHLAHVTLTINARAFIKRTRVKNNTKIKVLRAGQTVLILGAAGGVGVAAVQICKVLGAKVVAVARGESKARLLKDLGADAVIDTSVNQQAGSSHDLAYRSSSMLTGIESSVP